MAKRLKDRLAWKHPRMGCVQFHKHGWMTKSGKLTKKGIKEARKGPQSW